MLWRFLAATCLATILVHAQDSGSQDQDGILEPNVFKHWQGLKAKCNWTCADGSTECQQRKHNFKKNHQTMDNLNKTCSTDGGCHHKYGLTCFSGHSTEELRRYVMKPSKLPKKPHGSNGTNTQSPRFKRANVGTFDWRTTGAVNPIRDQEQCGDCWSFATVAVVEIQSNYVNNRLNTNRRAYSEQWVLDCSTTDGCDGGWPSDALRYVQQKGIARQASDPYKGKTSRCPTGVALDKAMSAQTDLTGKATSIQQWVQAHGPVTAAFYVCEDFYYYTSGIYSKDCTPNSSNFLGGHAVTIIGYGTTNGVDYWLVRNQWGTGWGIQGYFMIQRGSDTSSFESWGVTGITAPKIA